VSAAGVTGDRFRERLGRLLRAALDAVPFCEPTQDDRTLEHIDRQLTGAQLFISDTLYPPEEQRREREEEERYRRVLVRQRGLEDLLMRVDRDVQRVSQAIIGNQPAPIARIAVEMFVQGVVDLIDRVDARALDPDYVAIHPVSASRDPLVQRIVTLLHEVKRGAKS
jgi:hypothetical protein